MRGLERRTLTNAAFAAFAASSAGACSLIFSVSDWDSHPDATGGASASSSRSSAITSSASSGPHASSSSGRATSSSSGSGGAATSSSSSTGTGGAGTVAASSGAGGGCPAGGIPDDPNNCGACGFVCTGTCDGKRCAPVSLHVGGAVMLACAPGSVYYTTTGAVMQVDVAGTTHSTCWTATGEGPAAIAFGGGHVVWTAFGSGIGRVYTFADTDCAGSPPTAVFVADAAAPSGAEPPFRRGIAADDANVYWLDAKYANQAPLVPGDAGAITLLDLTNAQSSGLAVAGTKVYVSNYGFTDLYETPIGLADAAPSMDTVQRNCEGVHAVLDGSVGYAAWGVDLAPYSVSVKGIGPSSVMITAEYFTLASIPDRPTGLALDLQYVYATFSHDDAGSVVRYTIDPNDAGMTVLDTKLDTTIDDVCADDRFLYWIAGGDIWKSDKRP